MADPAHRPFHLNNSFQAQTPTYIFNVFPSPNRQLTAVPTSTGSVAIFNAADLSPASELAINSGDPDDTITDLLWDPAGAAVWVSTKRGQVALWDLRARAAVREFNGMGGEGKRLGGGDADSIGIIGHATYRVSAPSWRPRSLNLKQRRLCPPRCSAFPSIISVLFTRRYSYLTACIPDLAPLPLPLNRAQNSSEKTQKSYSGKTVPPSRRPSLPHESHTPPTRSRDVRAATQPIEFIECHSDDVTQVILR
ncbi:hypothetical protein BDK51DRAFT_45244 [Blyttiomyces helicus]|uniref:Anaphase-promoting complex subunit 4 WD40 domain-containing protein n=1 Tax=Blyttiomyces helicus TaxID=388810 RepID=A0A4P9VZD5_9FUNG|nr:hypothetical protein BDK51DRAFT_45244 [Blyttiomyces helicus]|eukprot:RKO84355.1 hypothetical protein BDK51DRAFT_45244 [Blyttiomyces helicus]